MLDLKCDWAVVDVVSVLGTNQNVTSHISKWELDANGVQQQFRSRNRKQNDILLSDSTVTQSLDSLYENGEDATSLDKNTLQYAQKENDYLFVDFFASWCSHCRDLAPTWEALAELMVDAGERLGNQHPDIATEKDYDEATKIELPVAVAKVDCVKNRFLCIQNQIRAYPTLRLFVDGKPWKGGDYQGHRTLLDMVEWLYHVEMEHKENMDERERRLHAAHTGEQNTATNSIFNSNLASRFNHIVCSVTKAARERLGEEASDEERRWHEKILQKKMSVRKDWKDTEHPGCMLAGYLLVDRAPGNFHIQARSQNQELDSHMTNTSHMVNSLSIGDPLVKTMIETGKSGFVPTEIRPKIAPLDGNIYITTGLHESYHHYLKLISTHVEGFQMRSRPASVYQMLASSQLAYYENDTVPEALFLYDLSPISVSYRTDSRHWYDFCTSVMAIVGGVFTVVGMLEASIHATITSAKRQSMRATKR